ncbi:unnamed protein product [Caenorhabditis brenneri]
MNSTYTPSHLLCAVCGDSANEISYGVPSCSSCKSFFQNAQSPNAPPDPCIPDTCSDQCEFCRYQQCVTSGMRYPTERQLCQIVENMKL